MSKLIRKDHFGAWRVSESHHLGGDLHLTVTTFKNHTGSIVTNASVAHREGGFDKHVMFQDFSKRLGIAKFRATASAVEEHHDAVIAQAGGIDTLIAEAKAHHHGDLKESA